MKPVKTDVRNRILMAARRLFAQQGYEATTVRQICKEAKSNLALVSYHFGGKESVFFAIFDEYFPRDSFCFNCEILDPEASLRQLIESIIKFKLEQPEMVSIIQQEILTNSSRLEGMGRYMYPIYNRIKEILEVGNKNGIFQYTSIDNAMIFVMSISTIPVNNTFLKPLLTDEKHEIRNLLEDTITFIFNALKHT